MQTFGKNEMEATTIHNQSIGIGNKMKWNETTEKDEEEKSKDKHTKQKVLREFFGYSVELLVAGHDIAS